MSAENLTRQKKIEAVTINFNTLFERLQQDNGTGTLNGKREFHGWKELIKPIYAYFSSDFTPIDVAKIFIDLLADQSIKVPIKDSEDKIVVIDPRVTVVGESRRLPSQEPLPNPEDIKELFVRDNNEYLNNENIKQLIRLAVVHRFRYAFWYLDLLKKV